MPRTQAEYCMFCGNTPCTCITEKPKPKPKVTKVVAPETTPEPKKYTMKSLPKTVEPQARTSLQNTTEVTAAADETRALRQALTVFADAGLLCSDDVIKYKDLLLMTPQQVRILAWKQRRLEWIISRQTNSR